jgi:hypothetical protein
VLRPFYVFELLSFWLTPLSYFFAGKMKTISDAEFASYLLRAKQKLGAPDAQVDPLSQVVVAEGAGGKGLKRG